MPRRNVMTSAWEMLVVLSVKKFFGLVYWFISACGYLDRPNLVVVLVQDDDSCVPATGVPAELTGELLRYFLRRFIMGKIHRKAKITAAPWGVRHLLLLNYANRTQAAIFLKCVKSHFQSVT